jgi:ribosomal protein L7Ae-like RNA K-turn-binding protein
MVNKKANGFKSKSKKKIRFILGRDMSEDEMVKAIRKMCDEAGVEFVPSKKKKK